MSGETAQERAARERRERIEASRRSLAESYAADPEGVQRFNLRMARLGQARDHERARVERAIRGGDPAPAAPDLTRPAGMSRQDWKILRAQRLRSHRDELAAWTKKQGTSNLGMPPPEQMARRPFVEKQVVDYRGGRFVKLDRTYCRQPRFETIEGLTSEQLAALRRYRKAFDASEMSPMKSALDVGSGGGSGGSHSALLRVEVIAFADVAVKRIEAAVPAHDLPVLRAIALHDEDFKAVALDRFGSASGQRRTRVRKDFIRAADSLVRAMAPPPSPPLAPIPTVDDPAGPHAVNPAFLDEQGRMRPLDEIAEIILAHVDVVEDDA